MSLLKSPASTSVPIRSLPSTYLRLPKIVHSSSTSFILSPTITETQIAFQSSQRRSLWGWGRRDHQPPWHQHEEDPFLRRLKRFQKQYLLKRAHVLRRQAWLHHRLPPHRVHHPDHESSQHQSPWPFWSWSWRGLRVNRPEWSGKSFDNEDYVLEGRSKRTDSPDEHNQADEFEQFRREVEKDPYNFLFGRSNKWLSYGRESRQPWSSFLQSFFGNSEAEDRAPKESQHIASTKIEMMPREGKNAGRDAHQRPLKDLPVRQADVPAATEAAKTTKATRFDPVTGRMVPVRSQKTNSTPDPTDIPIKRYVLQIGRDTSDCPSKKQVTKNQAVSSNDLLISKHYGGDALQISPAAEDMETLAPSSIDGNSITSSIDVHSTTRQTQASPPISQYDVFSTPETENPERPSRRKSYTLEESKQDDVDLLRASDVRASFILKKTQQDLEAEKKAQRDSLDQKFDAHQDPERDLCIQEVRRSHDEMRSSNTSAPSYVMSSTESRPELTSTEVDGADNLTNEIRKIYEDSYGKITPEHHQQFQSRSKSPWTVQSSNTQAIPNTRMSNKRSRADLIAALEETMNSVRKGIFDLEDRIERYSEHSGARSAKAKSQESDSSSALYRVLAYDSSSLQIVIAETGSTYNSPEAPLHPTDVLSRLNNPAKFLPFFGQMQADGYEIVSGGGDILVFKNIRQRGLTCPPFTSTFPSTSPSQSEVNVGSGYQIPKDTSAEDLISSTAPDSGSLQRTGTSPLPSPTSSEGSRMVRRQETVYTGGPPNWSPYPPTTAPKSPLPIDHTTNSNSSGKSSAASTSKQRFRENIFFLVMGAASIYAADVVYEYFRTGGEDGRGPEGFTEFEMERLRR